MIPPRLILAPVDFSECSRVSLAFAARLAQQCGAALHVLHAESPLLEAAARSRAIDLATQADTELRAFMASTYPAASGLALYRVVSGSPVSAICEAAAAHRADLIVMGPHGLSRLARAVLGSTTEGVLLRTSTDVMVVPPSWTAPAADVPGLSGIGPVVVGVRDVATARPAVETGKALAGALGTHVEAVRVVGEGPSDAVPVDSVLVKSLQGEPGAALLDYLATPEHSRSLLVLDRTHRRGKTGLGRTTRALLTYCQAPMFWRP